MSASPVSPPLASVKLPPPVPITVRRVRTPKKNIPQTKWERDRLLQHIRGYVERVRLVPPVPLEELRVHAETIIGELKIDAIFIDYTGVLLANELWREALATVPYERRLLLMPKCLRVESKCPAPFDEFGLLCKQCGLCSIQDFQNEAERLGYAVLVAEGSAVVMSLIQTGQIEAIVGISLCGGGGDPGGGGAAAAGRLHRHDGGYRLGVGLHPPDERGPHAAAEPELAARRGEDVVHTGEHCHADGAGKRPGGRDRAGVAGPGGQALAAIPDGGGEPGAAGGRGGAAFRFHQEAGAGRGVFSQGEPDPR